MKQSTLFLRREADRYYQRNLHKPREPDPVLEAIKAEQIRPHTVLEIGCGDGWRLQLIRRDLGAICYGIDPSKQAIADAPQDTARYGIKCWRGTADRLVGVQDHSIDMVIHAFELYLVDREDLFKVVCESDRVLRNGGYLVIHDFLSERAYSRNYEHLEGVRSYKQDYSKLWLGNPAYRPIRRVVLGTETSQPKNRDDQVGVIILRKDLAGAWPELEPVNILAAG